MTREIIVYFLLENKQSNKHSVYHKFHLWSFDIFNSISSLLSQGVWKGIPVGVETRLLCEYDFYCFR